MQKQTSKKSHRGEKTQLGPSVVVFNPRMDARSAAIRISINDPYGLYALQGDSSCLRRCLVSGVWLGLSFQDIASFCNKLFGPFPWNFQTGAKMYDFLFEFKFYDILELFLVKASEYKANFDELFSARFSRLLRELRLTFSPSCWCSLWHHTRNLLFCTSTIYVLPRPVTIWGAS